MCSPAIFLQVPFVKVDFSCHLNRNVCHMHSCLAPLSQACCWQLSLLLYPRDPSSCTFDSRLFGVVKRSITQCLWKGHAHRSNIMFQCDSHYRCCACTATIFKCYSLVVRSPPPPRGELSQHWGEITSGVEGTSSCVAQLDLLESFLSLHKDYKNTRHVTCKDGTKIHVAHFVNNLCSCQHEWVSTDCL